MTSNGKREKTTKRKRVQAPLINAIDLAKLGGGEIAYIKEMTSEEAEVQFPAIEGLPRGIPVFSLHAADGTPLAITDTRRAAIEHAIGDELAIATVH